MYINANPSVGSLDDGAVLSAGQHLQTAGNNIVVFLSFMTAQTNGSFRFFLLGIGFRFGFCLYGVCICVVKAFGLFVARRRQKGA